MTTKKHELHPNKWVDLHADYLYRYAATRISDNATEISDRNQYKETSS